MIKNFPNSTKHRQQESQRVDINQYFSKQRQIAKSRRHGSKDIPPKSPPTPNLQWLKQNKMNKQQQPTNKPHHSRHKSPITILQQSTADNINYEDEQQSNFVCSNHPDKKSKYFLGRDINIRLCTTCAVNYAQVQTVLDDEKFHKTNDITSLKQMIKMVKNMIPERQQEINKQIRIQDDLYKLSLEVIDNQFEMIFRSVQQKHSELIDYVHHKHRQYTIHLQSQKSVIPMVNNALQKYTFDIDRNYQQIINELSVTQFDIIMKQYRAKISDYSYKLDKQFEDLMDMNVIKNQVIDITSRIKNLTFEKGRDFGNGLLKPMLKRGENRNYTNILKAKTPDRHDRFN